jgi:hypothetical protein
VLCPECSELWEAYAGVFTRNADLVRQRVLTKAERDSPLFQSLTERIEAFTQERNALAETIKQHEERAHGRIAPL